MRRSHGSTQIGLDAFGIAGYAAVFGRESHDLGGFREVIEPGAFADALKRSDVVALLNHESSFLLGRTGAGTLRLWEDCVGLRFSIPELPRSRADVLEVIQRGDLRSCSFSFTVDRDRYERRSGRRIRLIESVKHLYDVSVVVYPAYPDTSVAVTAPARSGEPTWKTRARSRRRALDLAAVA